MSEAEGQSKFTSSIVISTGASTVVAPMTTKMTTSKSSMTKTTKIIKSSMTSSSSGTSSSSTSTTTTTETSSTDVDGKSKSTFSTITTKSSSGNFADGLAQRQAITGGIDLEKLVEEQMSKMRSQTFQLMPSSSPNVSPESALVHLDRNSISQYVDSGNKDLLAFNFDMKQYASESINVKTVGNQIEVHASRTTKSSDGSQTKEEFSRSYAMPTNTALDPAKITSGLFDDGVLSVQLPLSEAIQ
nr:small heat shock protein [Bonellia viridis]